ncbi:MAG: glycosyltransferase [Moraxella sp.]|nr:glycosyltransferase [Moraxella sp.]
MKSIKNNLVIENDEAVNVLINLTRHNFDFRNVIHFEQSSVKLNNVLICSVDAGNILTILDNIVICLYEMKATPFVVASEIKQIAKAHNYFEVYKINYGILIEGIIPQINWQYWTYFSNSSFIIATTKQALYEFRAKYIFQIQWWEDFVFSSGYFDGYQALCSEPDESSIKRLLIVSYFGIDLNAVGVLRARYWFENIKSISGNKIHVELATATRPTHFMENVHYIPDFGINSSLCTNAVEKDLSKCYENKVNTIGLSWNKELVSYFDKINKEYDIVLITGNPFLHFYFTIYSKLTWKAFVIQDYRDPLARNPRMNPDFIDDRARFEDEFCDMADAVVTVNQPCVDLLSSYSPKPIHVIANGYDDRCLIEHNVTNAKTAGYVMTSLENKIFQKIKAYKYELDTIPSYFVKSMDWIAQHQDVFPKGISSNEQVLRLVYAGSFSSDRNPKNLIGAVSSLLGYEFHHFGSSSKLFQSNNPRIVSHGKIEQGDIYSQLRTYNLGVVYCGHDFESTTKIYDYIACDLQILIITSEQNPRPLTLREELKDVEGVYWVKNTKQDIEKFLRNFKYCSIKRINIESFSRGFGTKKLIDLILASKSNDEDLSDVKVLGRFSYQQLIKKTDCKELVYDDTYSSLNNRESADVPMLDLKYGNAVYFNQQRLRFLTSEVAMMQYQNQKEEHVSQKSISLLTRSINKTLILCNDYPHQDNRYGGAFIAPRVRAYQRAGYKIEVFVFKDAESVKIVNELDNDLKIYRGGRRLLKKVLSRTAPCNIFAHSLSQPAFQIIKELGVQNRLTVFYHGFEVRDVAHLWYNFDREQLNRNFRRIFQQDLIRKKLAIEIFLNTDIKKVFVSRFLKQLCEDDLGISIQNSYIIPNYIDGNLFAYNKKEDSHRLKIFSIRPYDNHNYASDLIVECILALSTKPYFHKLSFHIQGFGRTFWQKTKAISGFENVVLKEGVLSQKEISSLHKDYGIALTPTRFDTQGVSLGEAMASGLVPVTNDCAAISEFIPQNCGVLAPYNDVCNMVSGIEAMYYDSSLFHEKSKNAARHIRNIAGFEATIMKEIELIRRSRFGKLAHFF